MTRDAEEEGSEDLLVAGGEGRERDGRTRGEREKKKGHSAQGWAFVIIPPIRNQARRGCELCEITWLVAEVKLSSRPQISDSVFIHLVYERKGKKYWILPITKAKCKWKTEKLFTGNAEDSQIQFDFSLCDKTMKLRHCSTKSAASGVRLVGANSDFSTDNQCVLGQISKPLQAAVSSVMKCG